MTAEQDDDRMRVGTRPSRAQVVERYSALARVAASGGEPIDTPTETQPDGCGSTAYGLTAADLGVPAGALRASMACGNPVAVADLQLGDTVLDLGCGGGLDVLLSARRVGPSGHVYGMDASPDMIDLARTHAAEAGVGNVEFRLGYLEDIPLPDAAVDVVISNCVFTLSTDKRRALAEAARVLRPGGCFGISDVLAEPGLDPTRRAEAEHAAGCPVGTLTAEEYRDQLLAVGFASTAIIPTHTLTGGLYSAIVQASTPHHRAPEQPPQRGIDHATAPGPGYRGKRTEEDTPQPRR
jgi:SAM-dependent methyltransferase